MDRTEEAGTGAKPSNPNRLWWWVGLAFALQIAAWTGWLIFASKHRVQEVPLVTTENR